MQEPEDGILLTSADVVEQPFGIVLAEVGRQLTGQALEPTAAGDEPEPRQGRRRPPGARVPAGVPEEPMDQNSGRPVSVLPTRSTSTSVVGAITAAARASRKTRSSGRCRE